MVLVVSGCALAPLEEKVESKDYVDKIHNVEKANYEFEARLDSFYESEFIDTQDLSDLYEGEFPNGERNPHKLRIHWKDARELALAEIELQKEAQNWTNVTISKRPILVLDRDGGDFYRYYEYRVLKEDKEVGAIRIPAYRRTENFATAEVHIYQNNGSKYKIIPTGWGVYIAKNSSLDPSGSFIQSIDYSSNINKNFIYTIMLKYLSKKLDSTISRSLEIPNHIAQESMNTIINAFEKNNDAIKELKSRNKGEELPSHIHNKCDDEYGFAVR